MLKTLEATIDVDGNIRLAEPADLVPGERVLVTLLGSATLDQSILSEQSLATDWLRDEEDAAWSDLHPEQS